MKNRKRIKAGYLLALAALIILPCLRLMQAQAASEIDLNHDCSLTVSVEVGASVGSNAQYLEDFNQMAIPVSVYKTADLDVTGQKFTGVGAFAGMNFDSVNNHPGSVTADDWQKLSEEAEKILESASVQAAGSATVQKMEGAQTASGVITGLTPGLYLVAPEATYNSDYTVQYEFAPYLTALPSSQYTLEGQGSDEWMYDTTIGLKPDALPQFGKLNIIKILKNYNETLGRTTFVFHIVGVDQDGVTRYDEVESMTYTAAGSNTVTIDNLPAGLKITVTEIYSGASYTIDGDNKAQTVIWSDAAVSAGKAEEASVTFQNRYDGGDRGGYGVTNHFESDGKGGWTWENPTTPLKK